jgi:hypothetical protein
MDMIPFLQKKFQRDDYRRTKSEVSSEFSVAIQAREKRSCTVKFAHGTPTNGLLFERFDWDFSVLQEAGRGGDGAVSG